MINLDPDLDNYDLIDHQCKYFTSEEFLREISPTPLPAPRNQFSLLHINARSLNKNFDSVELFLSSINNFSFSLIGITETWLNINSPQMFNLQNYDFIRSDREHGRGGGVAMYVNNQIKFKIRPDIHITGAEDLFIEILNDRHKNTIIGTIYRPPNSETDTFLNGIDTQLNNCLQENKNIYLMGDFNLDLLSNSHSVSQFTNILQANALYPHINKPTRFCNTGQSLLDNIFSNVLHNSKNGIFYSDISDHLPIFHICDQSNNLNSISSKQKDIFHRKDSQENIDILNFHLSQEEWLDVLREDDANKSYDIFIHKLLHYYNQYIPLVKTTKRKYQKKQPWITNGILRSIHTRTRLYKISLRHPTATNKEKYKTYRNKLTAVIRVSRKLYYSTQLENNKNNVNLIWKTINDIIKNKKKDFPDSVTESGNTICLTVILLILVLN